MPFLISGAEIPTNQKLDVIAQPIDILPTLKELGGFETETRAQLEGRSFADALRGNASIHRDLAVSATFVMPGANGRCNPKSVTPFVVGKKWGFAPVGAEGSAELYDLEIDPLATTNLASSHGSEVKAMSKSFSELMRAHGASGELIDCWSI